MITKAERKQILLQEYLIRKAEDDKRRRLERRVTKRQAAAYKEAELTGKENNNGITF